MYTDGCSMSWRNWCVRCVVNSLFLSFFPLLVFIIHLIPIAFDFHSGVCTFLDVLRLNSAESPDSVQQTYSRQVRRISLVDPTGAIKPDRTRLSNQERTILN